MREMGWSWRELLDTPAGVVDEIAERIEQQEYWTAKREKLHGPNR